MDCININLKIYVNIGASLPLNPTSRAIALPNFRDLQRRPIRLASDEEIERHNPSRKETCFTANHAPETQGAGHHRSKFLRLDTYRNQILQDGQEVSDNFLGVNHALQPSGVNCDIAAYVHTVWSRGMLTRDPFAVANLLVNYSRSDLRRILKSSPEQAKTHSSYLKRPLISHKVELFAILF